MPVPSSIIVPKRRIRRKRRSVSVIPVPQALTIVSASFDQGFPQASIQFDREIDVSAIVRTAFVINDDRFTGNVYTCAEFGASHDGPNGITMNLQVIGVAEGGQVRLTVAENNGIVAVDDGGTFAGVINLQLPFPHDQIASVTHDHEEAIVVALTDAVESIGLPGIEVSSNGVEWIVPESVNVEDARNPVFTFAQDVSAATMWRVTDVTVWYFPDGELMGATSGSIA